MSSSRVLVTGASGYVGGRLVPALLESGVRVRCLVRTPAKLAAAPWVDQVDVVQGSVGDDLTTAMSGVDVAVYLVHSIGAGSDWVEQELRDAQNFAEAAQAAGVGRIVYLGGLGAGDETLSRHLQSRQNVGAALASTNVATVEIRAGVIIGSGSASFEMLRYLAEVLPVMVTPKWVSTKCQPIAIANIVSILVAAITTDAAISGVYEAGGPEVITYANMMETYAECAGLRRRILIPVPFLTPRLSSHWIGLVTPVPVPLAKELVNSLVNEVIVTGRDASSAFGVTPMPLHTAISRALDVTQRGAIPTTFFDADLVHFRATELDPAWAGGTVFSDQRRLTSALPLDDIFAELATIGGEKGWYAGELLWKVRGFLDQLIGGPGMRRGRKAELYVGDALDFWRIEAVERPTTLRLRAEMRLPGDAWLTWQLTPRDGGTLITQTAEYRPRGLLGRLYWAVVWPFHGFIFPVMLKRIVRAATPRS
jgi:uncharacterized protein YbjT (DUF2867 family)